VLRDDQGSEPAVTTQAVTGLARFFLPENQRLAWLGAGRHCQLAPPV